MLHYKGYYIYSSNKVKGGIEWVVTDKGNLVGRYSTIGSAKGAITRMINSGKLHDYSIRYA